jgi:hypothetical protein
MLLANVFVAFLLISGILMTAIGLITFIQFARTKPAPADSSNRINHIRLWWFALTRPELFVDTFPWMRNDELENMETKDGE